MNGTGTQPGAKPDAAVRFATPEDGAALLAIYAQYIQTPITFEYALPSEREFAQRIGNISREYPYLICEKNGCAIAYAYAHRHMEREAYQWGAELSVYIARNHTGLGLGKGLYRLLMDILRLQGVKTVYGGVTLPNPKSEALHASMGFALLGVYRNAGYKNGAWHDVAWFEKQSGPYDADPRPVTAVSALDKDRLARALGGA